LTPHADSLPLAVFAKRPVPGEVKTRLVPPLTPGAAAEFAQAMLDDRMDCLRGARLVIAPSPAGGEVAWARGRYPGCEVSAQRGADLGARLAGWFERVGTGLVVGADSPTLGGELVGLARTRLRAGADAVFAPDQGGGYALVGLTRSAPELFTEVPMSTEDNLDRTLDRARELGLTVELLPAQLDIDTEPDLAALLRELRTREAKGRRQEFPERTFRALQALMAECAR
jgi:uncharacterized protein